MTNKERANYALEMARRRIDSGEGWTDAVRFVEDAITAAVAEEREACAKIVEDKYDSFTDTQFPFAGPPLLEASKAIRARCKISEEGRNDA